jgi:hypothetical protein
MANSSSSSCDLFENNMAIERNRKRHEIDKKNLKCVAGWYLMKACILRLLA